VRATSRLAADVETDADPTLFGDREIPTSAVDTNSTFHHSGCDDQQGCASSAQREARRAEEGRQKEKEEEE
jgi:hypothetical protein